MNYGSLSGSRPYLGFKFKGDSDVAFAKTVFCFTPRRNVYVFNLVLYSVSRYVLFDIWNLIGAQAAE